MKTQGPRGLVMLALVAFVLVHMVLLLVHRLPHGDEFRYVHEFTPQGKSFSEFVGWHPFVVAMSVQSYLLLGPLGLDSVYAFRWIAVTVALAVVVSVILLYRAFDLPVLSQIGFTFLFTWSLFLAQFGTSAVLWYVETVLLGCISFLILDGLLERRFRPNVPGSVVLLVYFLLTGWFHPGLSFLAGSVLVAHLLTEFGRSRAEERPRSAWRDSSLLLAAGLCVASIVGSAVYLRYFAHSQLFRRKSLLAEFYFDLSSYPQTLPGALRFSRDRIVSLVDSVFTLQRYPALRSPGSWEEVLSQVAIWTFVVGLVWGLVAGRRTRTVVLGFILLLLAFTLMGLAGVYPLSTADRGYRYFTFSLVYFYLIFGFGVAAAGRPIRLFMDQLAARRAGLRLGPGSRGRWAAAGLTLTLLVLVTGDLRVWHHLDETRADFLATLYRPDLAPVLLEERGYRTLYSMGQLPPRIVRFNEKRQQLRPLRKHLRKRGQVAMVMVGGFRINQNLSSELEGKRLSARPLSRHSSLGLYWLTADAERSRKHSR